MGGKGRADRYLRSTCAGVCACARAHYARVCARVHAPVCAYACAPAKKNARVHARARVCDVGYIVVCVLRHILLGGCSESWGFLEVWMRGGPEMPLYGP
nr:MAG TPA: hypothetical protein [Caudoviricetes sp.]